jgi:hypothetical protein
VSYFTLGIIIILMETIKGLYIRAQPQSRSIRAFVEVVERGPKHSSHQ